MVVAVGFGAEPTFSATVIGARLAFGLIEPLWVQASVAKVHCQPEPEILVAVIPAGNEIETENGPVTVKPAALFTVTV